MRDATLVLLLTTTLASAACAPPDGEAEHASTRAPAAAASRGDAVQALVSSGLEGHVRAYVVDYEDGGSRTGYALERGPGDYVELLPTAEVTAHVDDLVTIEGDEVIAPPALGARDRDRVHAGSRRLRVTSLVVRERAGDRQPSLVAPADEGPTKVLSGGPPVKARIAVVLLNFEGVTPQTFSVSDAQANMTTVRAYYQEISYGNWNIESDVFGPFQVPKPADCDLGTIGDLARQAAKAGGVAIDSYDHVGVTLPSNDDSGLGCACGLAWVGRAPALTNPGIQHTSLFTCTDPNAFAHEARRRRRARQRRFVVASPRGLRGHAVRRA
jgi:hypothetical protein